LEEGGIVVKELFRAACLSSLLVISACGGQQADVAPEPVTQVSFAKDVRPILEAHCTRCHEVGSDLSLDSYQALMAVREGVRVVVPGSPDASQMVKVIEEARMPKSLVHEIHRPTLERELGLLRLWIAQGARDN
jgi:hypothetical protein